MNPVIEEIKRVIEDHKAQLLSGVESRIDERMNQLTAMETRIKELETQWKERAHVPGLEDEKQQFSLFKAIWAIKSNDWANAGFEKEVFTETRKKAMAMGTGSSGGYIVPTIYLANIIELLRAEAVIGKMGATFLSDLQGSPVQIPRQSGGATAYWVGENSAITATDLTLEQLSLTPKKVGALVKMSNSLIKLSNPSAEALVNRDIAQVLALDIDLKALRGTGGSNQPTGIASTSGIGTVAIGTNGGSVTWDHLIDMEYSLALSNALRGNLGFVFHPCIRRNLLKKKVPNYSGQTDGAYILQPATTEADFKNWVGHPYAMTTQIPINLTKAGGTALTEIYFGNWQELIVANWGGMEIMASQETSDAFEKDQTWVRILQEVDIAVRHAASFCLINDASSAS